jgi:predicted DNA-binding transcriptional regulator AlpA
MQTFESDLIPLPPDNDTLVTAERLPAHIGVANQTLARWRHEGQGPKFVKVGRLVAYRAGDVRRWLGERTYAHTTQAQANRPAA